MAPIPPLLPQYGHSTLIFIWSVFDVGLGLPLLCGIRPLHDSEILSAHSIFYIIIYQDFKVNLIPDNAFNLSINACSLILICCLLGNNFSISG